MDSNNLPNDELLRFVFGELDAAREAAARQAVTQSPELAAAAQGLAAAAAALRREEMARVSDKFNDRLRQRMPEVLGERPNFRANESGAVPFNVETLHPTFLTRSLDIWRWIMRSRISRVAAAAIFVFAVTGVVLWFHGAGATLAFADFIEPILEVKSAKFKSTSETEGRRPETFQTMFLAPDRFRNERPETVIICQPGKMLILAPREKRATITDFANVPQDVAAKNWFADLQTHLLQTRDDPKVKRETLGEKEIDGHLAVGYRLVMTDRVIVLWGNPKTGLPVRIEQRSAANPESKMIMTDFVFNVALDESLFSLEAPAGYTVSHYQVDASAPDEKSLVDSLRCFGDLFGGDFPGSFVINDRTMNPVMEKLFVKKGWKIAKGSKPNQEQLHAIQETLSRIGRGFEFAADLPPSSDTHYAGKGVRLGMADTPIFWYRPKDSKKYRVIYADLSVRDADAPPNVPNAQPVPGPSSPKK
jgi:outer membrane lipoprotein-sorting protein